MFARESNEKYMKKIQKKTTYSTIIVAHSFTARAFILSRNGGFEYNNSRRLRVDRFGCFYSFLLLSALESSSKEIANHLLLVILLIE